MDIPNIIYSVSVSIGNEDAESLRRRNAELEKRVAELKAVQSASELVENGDYTRPNNFRKRFHRILEAAGIEIKGLHSLRHTFATTLVNGVPQPDGTIKSLSPRQVADLLGHSTSEITEMYYVKKDMARLGGITNGFEI
ncbi:MAG: tyrosine-type recombinase/integrase [Clostridia bacterium]|nr:tyrosine-type recombinase/integrase [Clostridia bacterium]